MSPTVFEGARFSRHARLPLDITPSGLADRDAASRAFIAKYRSLIEKPPETGNSVWVVTSKRRFPVYDVILRDPRHR